MHVIHYQFELANTARDDAGALRLSYRLELDGATLLLAPYGPGDDISPEWARLTANQCPNCPLCETQARYCPAALHLAPLLRDWRQVVSHTPVAVVVTDERRTVSGQTTAQQALSSLLGLVMATSGCPRTAFLRPMARFHLPLADDEETLYRAVAMDLLRQYLCQPGQAATLEQLTVAYHELEVVNRAMAARLRQASERDGPINALAVLDIFTKTLPRAIDRSLQQLRYLFPD